MGSLGSTSPAVALAGRRQLAKRLVQPADLGDHRVVVVARPQAQAHQHAGHAQRAPAADVELFVDRDAENRHAHHGAEQEQRQPPPPQGCSCRNCHQWRNMPIIDSENVRNTLIEYMITSVVTLPPV